LPGEVVCCKALLVTVNYIFYFVEKFLGSADAEGWNQDDAAILECEFYHFLRLCLAEFAVFVKTVTVGAFKDHQVGSIGRLRRGKKRRIWGAEVAGERDALLFAEVLEVAV